ncbi:MAG: chromate efflux transporter [Rhodospirillaceae bacterium]
MEVFKAFFLLGLTSFGGPTAHLGFFREAFTQKRKWLTDAAYADLVALCQFLPGPASSQTGFAIGLLRAGPAGAAAAFVAFTLPSALAMGAFGVLAASLPDGMGAGVLHGLKVVAVAVVAQAVLGMARSLCPDNTRAGLAFFALALMLAWPEDSLLPLAVVQLIPFFVGGAVGYWLLQKAIAGAGSSSGSGSGSGSGTTSDDEAAPLSVPLSQRFGVGLLVSVPVLLLVLPVLAGLTGSSFLDFFDAIFRSGALVFGGGHVVLPLLQESVVDPGYLSADDFLAGYGVVQAMPGPLFTIASHMGAAAGMAGTIPGGALIGCLMATIAIFLPGFLLLLGTLPFWASLRDKPKIRAALAGVNAAVVGLLGAALYDPVFTAAVTDKADVAGIALAYFCLAGLKLPPWLVVVGGGLVGLVLV